MAFLGRYISYLSALLNGPAEGASYYSAMTTSIDPIGVTGVTGFVGGRVAASLNASEIPLRLLVRDAQRAPQLTGCTAAVAPYGDRDRVRSALTGVETVLMVSAAESADRVEQHRIFIEAAVEAGVGHIVYTSFVGAAEDATFTLARDHWATEEAIRRTGLSYTFLRDNFYTDFLPTLAGPDGVIRGPAGDGRVASVCRADVARCAVAVLSEPEAHRDRTYELTGPASLSLHEVAEVMTSVTGQQTTFYDESVEEAHASRARWSPPPWQMEAWVSTYLAIADGSLAAVSDDVAEITGREPLSLQDFLLGAGSPG